MRSDYDDSREAILEAARARKALETTKYKHSRDFFDWKKPYYPYVLETKQGGVEHSATSGVRNPPPGLSNVPYLDDENSPLVQHSKTLTLLKEVFSKKRQQKYFVRAELHPHQTKFRFESERARLNRMLRPPVAPKARKRGVIRELSERARERLISQCHELQAIGHKPDYMITLTYPGNYQAVMSYQTCCCSDVKRKHKSESKCKNWLWVHNPGRAVHRHLEAFRKRLERYFDKRGLTFSALWFLEFQSRGAAHVHLLLWGQGLKERVNLNGFRSQMGKAWTNIIAPPDKSEYIKSAKAGTSIERMRTEHFGYASKYASKIYQKEVPEDFSDVGRFWGTWNYEKPKTKYINFEVKLFEYRAFA
jgi:hypothetical protein